MTTVVDFEIAAGDTILGEVFTAFPSTVCEMEQVIASDGHGLWLAGPTRPEIETALDADPSVESVSLLSAADDRWLYDVSFDPDALDVFEVIVAHGGTILSAAAEDGQWQLRIRFADREDASRVYDHLVAQDVGTTLVRLSTLSEQSPADYGLTEKQYEALLAALDHGYFTIPRETSMEELATELGVSHQALSERLRRAYRALVVTELNGAVSFEAPASPDQTV